ncbi:MAG: hypothetical protein AABW59_00270 [archaeon]
MQYNAQGAIEYLLIIGAAILVVAIVILAVTGVLSGGQDQATAGQESTKQAYSGLDKLKADEVALGEYAYSGIVYLKTINFRNETNCTIREAIVGLASAINNKISSPGAGDGIYLGGNNTNYCGIMITGLRAGQYDDSGVLDCNAKIETNRDYNFQIYTTGTLTSELTWKAWCD